MRANDLLTYNDETLPVKAWAARLGTETPTLHHRWKAGWSVERIVTTPVRSPETCKFIEAVTTYLTTQHARSLLRGKEGS